MSTTTREHHRATRHAVAYVLVGLALAMLAWLGFAVVNGADDADEAIRAEVAGSSANDALVIEGSTGQTVAANFPASARGPEPPPVTVRSLWWRWTAPADGRVTFATHGSEFDTVLHVYSGEPPDLGEVAVNDDDGDVSTSSATIDVISDETYYVEVVAKDGDTGLVTLTWSDR